MPFKMQSRRLGSLSFFAVAVAHELFREGRADGGVAGSRWGGPCRPCTEPKDSEDRPEETLRAIFSQRRDPRWCAFKRDRLSQIDCVRAPAVTTEAVAGAIAATGCLGPGD